MQDQTIASSDNKSVLVTIDTLPLGIASERDVTDRLGTRLIPAGQVIDKRLIQGLIDDGFRDVQLHLSDVERFAEFAHSIRADVNAAGDESIRSLPETEPSDRSEPKVATLPPFEPLDADRAQRFEATLEKASELIAQFGASLGEEHLDALEHIPLTLASMLREDTDQAVGKQIEMAGTTDLTTRCMELAVMAMGVAQSMGYSAAEIQEVGFAGLLHDLSLFAMPEHFVCGRSKLTADEALRYRSHGQETVEMIRTAITLPPPVECMILQVHERRDGSGFPKGVCDNLLHPRSRILQVVDAYLTLIRPGPGRPGVVPHDAMAFLLHQSASGLFDGPVTRAFLLQMTLFPIGSRVELSDGRHGRVARRRGDFYSQPLVVCHQDDQINYVDLTCDEATIARPLMDAASRQERLKLDKIATLSWDDVAGFQALD